jgi:hypothetical protein
MTKEDISVLEVVWYETLTTNQKLSNSSGEGQILQNFR